jgi:pyruvate/2-oxoglutarate/acetoin dehydrogenase E1 component
MEHKLIYKIKDYVELNDIPKESSMLGKANIVSEGKDITIVSYSNMVNISKEAIVAKELQDYSIELIDLQTVSPIDYDTIKTSLKKTKKLLVCQEAPSNSSVGTTVISKIVESELFNELEIAPKLISGLHSPMPSAKHLELNVIPQVEDITNAVKSML